MTRTTRNLIDEVISKIDQNNRETVTETDILEAINRGYDNMVDIVATRQEDMLLSSRIFYASNVSTDSDSNRYLFIPEDCYQFRVISIDARDNADADWWPMTLINAQESYGHEWKQLIPADYRQVAYYYLGRKIVLVPDDSVDQLDAYRMRFVQRPLPLVTPQGQVVAWNSNTPTITLDAVGSDLSVTVTDVENFIHIINGQTGEVRSTHQILNKTSSVLTLRVTPTRSTFMEFAVSGVLPTTIAVDDYVCVATGTCVPFLDSPLTRTVVDLAVNDIESFKLGTGDKAVGMQIVSRAESKVKDLTANRPKRVRVKSSAPWSRRPFP